MKMRLRLKAIPKPMMAFVLSASLIGTSSHMAEAVFDGPQIFARPALPAQFELTPPKSLGVLTDSFSAGEDRPLLRPQRHHS